jgi:hypothetical protein
MEHLFMPLRDKTAYGSRSDACTTAPDGKTVAATAAHGSSVNGKATGRPKCMHIMFSADGSAAGSAADSPATAASGITADGTACTATAASGRAAGRATAGKAADATAWRPAAGRLPAKGPPAERRP